jgi:hypothetical protein
MTEWAIYQNTDVAPKRRVQQYKDLLPGKFHLKIAHAIPEEVMKKHYGTNLAGFEREGQGYKFKYAKTQMREDFKKYVQTLIDMYGDRLESLELGIEYSVAENWTDVGRTMDDLVFFEDVMWNVCINNLTNAYSIGYNDTILGDSKYGEKSTFPRTFDEWDKEQTSQFEHRIGIHLYGNNRKPFRWDKDYKKIQEHIGKDLYITETGWDAWYKRLCATADYEQEQADYWEKQLEFIETEDTIKRVDVYAPWQQDPKDGGLAHGLISPDYEPRKAFYVLKKYWEK